MKYICFLFFTLCFIFSCSNKNTDAVTQEKFDRALWLEKEGKDYTHRDKMLNHLIANYKLSGLKKNEVLDLLGEPSKTDSNYIFYTISQPHFGVITLSNKSLVIKFTNDTVEWRKIHE